MSTFNGKIYSAFCFLILAAKLGLLIDPVFPTSKFTMVCLDEQDVIF